MDPKSYSTWVGLETVCKGVKNLKKSRNHYFMPFISFTLFFFSKKKIDNAMVTYGRVQL